MGFFYHHCSLENWSGLAVRCKKKKVKKRFPVYVLSLALVLFFFFIKKNSDFSSFLLIIIDWDV
jgi:hypothetical protein